MSVELELTAEQHGKYKELLQLLKESPEPETSEVLLEEQSRRLLRWLRSENFNPQAAFVQLHDHAKWWQDYKMDDFLQTDELDETGPFFVCGEDRDGRPTVIARPCAHRSTSREESILAARRCVYTFQRCIERMPPEIESATIIYDMVSLSRKNLDLVFAQEVSAAFTDHFPGRLHRIIIINSHWTMSFFWLAISPLLHPVVKSKILVRSVDKLGEFLAEDHPYLQYVVNVRQKPVDRVPLPQRSPYICRCRPLVESSINRDDPVHNWKEVEDSPWSRQTTAASESEAQSQETKESLWSRQSTAATETELQSQETEAFFFGVHTDYALELPELPDCSDQLDSVEPSQRSWWLAFPCGYGAQPGTNSYAGDTVSKKSPSDCLRNDLIRSI